MDLNIYAQLLAKSLIKPIQSESDYDLAISEVDGLMHKENLTLEEEALLTLWAIVIEDYENKHYPIEKPRMKPKYSASIISITKHRIQIFFSQLLDEETNKKIMNLSKYQGIKVCSDSNGFLLLLEPIWDKKDVVEEIVLLLVTEGFDRERILISDNS